MVQNKARLAKVFHVQPSEIDRMPYWEYEEFIQAAAEIIEEENKQQEDAGGQGKHKTRNDYMRDANNNANGMMRRAQSGVKMPSMPKISMPKI